MFCWKWARISKFMKLASKLAKLAREKEGPLPRISCAMASHAIRTNDALVKEIVEPIFAQWKRTIQIDPHRGHVARMNMVDATEIIRRFECRMGNGLGGKFGSPSQLRR